MKILDVQVPIDIIKVYQEWLNIMELKHNEIVFTMFIEDVLKSSLTKYTIIDINLEKLYNQICVNFSQIINDEIHTGFYYTVFNVDNPNDICFLKYINEFYNDYIRN